MKQKGKPVEPLSNGFYFVPPWQLQLYRERERERAKVGMPGLNTGGRGGLGSFIHMSE